jgi:hypothetical protein
MLAHHRSESSRGSEGTVTEFCNKFLKALSAVTMVFGVFTANSNIQQGIFALLMAILFHMWSEEK